MKIQHLPPQRGDWMEMTNFAAFLISLAIGKVCLCVQFWEHPEEGDKTWKLSWEWADKE